MKSYTNWNPGYTIIVPGNFGGTRLTGETDLLLYNGATGGVGFFDVWGLGNINLMKSYTDWSAGHTIIVPGNFGGIGQTDLLIYDGATGGAGFFDVWGEGNINLMKSYTDWSPGHTFIVPGDFSGTALTGQTDLMIYDASTGGAGGFDVWGQGNLNYLGPVSNFPKQNWSLAATHFAVFPEVLNLIPNSGQGGSMVTVKGINLNGTARVLFGGTDPHKGVDAKFSVLSSTTISATVPTPAPTGFVRVVTPLGTSGGQNFVGLPPLVPVPNVVGDSLQVASQTLQNAGLQVGKVSPPNASGPVVSQSPAPPASVAPGSKVDLVVNTSPGPGFSKVTLTNNLESNDSVYIWLYDSSNGNYTEQNGGNNILAFNNSITVALPSSTYYTIYAVDPAFSSSCDGDDPQNNNCIPWQQTFLGNPTGPTLTCSITGQPCSE
jgi:hypothetical protein